MKSSSIAFIFIVLVSQSFASQLEMIRTQSLINKINEAISPSSISKLSSLPEILKTRVTRQIMNPNTLAKQQQQQQQQVSTNQLLLNPQTQNIPQNQLLGVQSAQSQFGLPQVQSGAFAQQQQQQQFSPLAGLSPQQMNLFLQQLLVPSNSLFSSRSPQILDNRISSFNFNKSIQPKTN